MITTIIRKTVKCVHNVHVTKDKYDRNHQAIVFIDGNASTYIWVTASTAANEFEEGHVYTIKANLDEDTHRLSGVKLLSGKAATTPASEQMDKNKNIKDVFDLIYDIKE